MVETSLQLQPGDHIFAIRRFKGYSHHGDSLQVKDYNGNSKPSYEVVQTAYRLLQDGFGEYELIMKNCEHFATFCKTGKTQSAQVDKAIDIAFERLVLPAAPIVESVFVLSKLLRSQFGIKTLIRR
ncbi:lecithin retinol acyltransferase isoform X3 [Jatropha curcas]|uniref:lecithin retinol acyltransferase isoform X3 n=1 Tax=Jatropha curcas TaxID=180498 RepID=UPI0009D69A35|nr:lecithin retinol acyltransferase isoform X3 [Jatropha curcas]